MTPDKPGRGSDQFPLRLPDGMRQSIKDAAAASGRSMNSEIVHILENGLGSVQTAGGFHYLEAFAPDVLVRARVVARFQLAAAEHAGAQDLVFISPDLAARIAATGAKVHDAAKASIEAAYPADPTSAAEILEVLKSGRKAEVAALIERLEQQVGAGAGRTA